MNPNGSGQLSMWHGCALCIILFFCSRQQHSSWSCRHFHVSLHADGRLKLWLRPSLPSVRVQVLPGPEHLSLHPNWNQKRNAIRSAWPDAEEGWLRVRPSKKKKEKGQSTQASFMLPWGSSGGIQINSLWYCHRFISCVNLSSPGIFFFFLKVRIPPFLLRL